MKILVIGSEGTIGTDLVKKLAPTPGNRITRCDRVRNRAADYVMADITRHETLEAAFDHGPEIVFHLAGEVSRETAEHWPTIAVDNNVLGTLNVIKLCLKHGAKMVYAGTSEEYGAAFLRGEPVTEETTPFRQQGVYGLTKWMAEELVEYYHRRYGLRAVIARIFMCYGPGERPNPYRSAVTRFIEWARKGQPLTVHEGAARSWCFIDDTVDGLIALSGCQREDAPIYNIGNDETWEMTDVAREIIRLTGSGSEIRLVKAPPGITLVKKASFARAREELGWQARVPFRDGLRRTVEWQLENIPLDGDG